MTNKALGRLMMILGALLLAAAVSLVAFNLLEDRIAGEKAERVLVKLKEKLPEGGSDKPSDSSGQAGESAPVKEGEAPREPEALEIDGEFYMGIISIPRLGIELPVTRDYSEENMKLAPSRWKGTLEMGDLIICGHNYESFFKGLDSLTSGDELIFTDLKGTEHRFSVSYTELVDGYDTEDMMSGSENWDLTLFTCTWSGRSRITVRAVRNE
ncbi:MAG: sortase [Ruminococcus sp.]|nr:sortase [Ruminococcus sp.]